MIVHLCVQEVDRFRPTLLRNRKLQVAKINVPAVESYSCDLSVDRGHAQCELTNRIVRHLRDKSNETFGCSLICDGAHPIAQRFTSFSYDEQRSLIDAIRVGCPR